jgi:dipeptidyl-peptidase 4
LEAIVFARNRWQMKNPITSGKFTITEVKGIDQKNRVLYFHARGLENSARFDLYRVGLDGKNMKRLTFGDFNHRRIEASPDLSYFVTTYSNLSTPNAMAIIDNTGKIVKDLGSAKGSEYDNYAINKPELVRVKSDDGKFDLPMTIVYPENYVAGKKYPVIVSIYGGPDAGRCMTPGTGVPDRSGCQEKALFRWLWTIGPVDIWQRRRGLYAPQPR